MEIRKPYTQANLADDLEKHAGQIRPQDPQRMFEVLKHAELEDGFVECVRALLAYTKPPSEEDIAIRERVGETIRLSKEPYDWPDVSEPDFVITVDFDNPN